ncbi:MAG TPA: Clp protease N-terminal domain-containing protein [Streptosporangiaceae bacterium]|jgi:hypothetical protein|nr:Clp protease N-terminal domain-containing protein [Streptosporangiaceae bacterium]
MTEEPARLGNLIEYVLERHPDGDALVRLTDAVLAAQKLDDIEDQLIGHFVDQARHSGVSWRAIGEAMGVSKQAAQQRFGPIPGLDLADQPLNRFTPRARNAIVAARREATAMSQSEVGTEHLLLGLLSEPDGLAARAIVAQNVSAQQIRDRAKAGPEPDRAAPAERIRLSLDAQTAVELGLSTALSLGHNYMGTEHLLLGILADGKSTGAKILAALGVTESGAKQWVLATLHEIVAQQTGPA